MVMGTGDTKRIELCLKACEGIPDRALEYGVIQDLRDACFISWMTILETEAWYQDRELFLLESRLRLVLSKINQTAPEGLI